jgi:hypothetical protein
VLLFFFLDRPLIFACKQRRTQQESKASQPGYVRNHYGAADEKKDRVGRVRADEEVGLSFPVEPPPSWGDGSSFVATTLLSSPLIPGGCAVPFGCVQRVRPAAAHSRCPTSVISEAGEKEQGAEVRDGSMHHSISYRSSREW